MNRILNHVHREMLKELVAAGHGIIDRNGRVCVGPIKRPIIGDALGWLILVSHGLVAGEREMIIPTEGGRAYAETLGKGRVRESAGD